MQKITELNSPLSVLEQRINYAEKHLSNTIQFHENIPTWNKPNELKLKTTLHASYMPTLGFNKLREAISLRESQKYGIPVRESNILITGGGLHALQLLFDYIAQTQGRQAICQVPVYHNIYKQLHWLKYNIIPLTLNEEESCIKFLNTYKSNLIYVNTPNNPLGTVIDEAAMKIFCAHVHDHHSNLVCDMVYDDFYDGTQRVVSPLQLYPSWDRIFAINSMSKSYGVPGLRIGWIVTSEKNIEQLSGILEKQMISIASANQQIAEQLLRTGNDDLVIAISKTKKYMEQKKSYFPGLDINQPTAGVQYLLQLPCHIDISLFADFMLLNHNLLLATSESYAGADYPFVRISCCYKQSQIDQAFLLLVRGLTEFCQKDISSFDQISSYS